MAKRAAKGKGKASRRYVQVPVPESKIDSVVFKCLVEFFRAHPPPIPPVADVRIERSPEWMTMLYRMGSTARLAEYLETTEMTVNRWVRGDNAPDDLMLLKVRALATSLGLPSPL